MMRHLLCNESKPAKHSCIENWPLLISEDEQLKQRFFWCHRRFRGGYCDPKNCSPCVELTAPRSNIAEVDIPHGPFLWWCVRFSNVMFTKASMPLFWSKNLVHVYRIDYAKNDSFRSGASKWRNPWNKLYAASLFINRIETGEAYLYRKWPMLNTADDALRHILYFWNVGCHLEPSTLPDTADRHKNLDVIEIHFSKKEVSK